MNYDCYENINCKFLQLGKNPHNFYCSKHYKATLCPLKFFFPLKENLYSTQLDNTSGCVEVKAVVQIHEGD